MENIVNIYETNVLVEVENTHTDYIYNRKLKFYVGFYTNNIMPDDGEYHPEYALILESIYSIHRIRWNVYE